MPCTIATRIIVVKCFCMAFSPPLQGARWRPKSPDTAEDDRFGCNRQGEADAGSRQKEGAAAISAPSSSSWETKQGYHAIGHDALNREPGQQVAAQRWRSGSRQGRRLPSPLRRDGG